MCKHRRESLRVRHVGPKFTLWLLGHQQLNSSDRVQGAVVMALALHSTLGREGRAKEGLA